MPHFWLIFHEQQGFRPARHRTGFDEFCIAVQRFLHLREEDLEGRAPADPAVNVNVAPGLLDDGLAGRQAQTGAFACRLRGKKASKMRALTSSVMPVPVSLTLTITWLPGMTPVWVLA